MIFDGELSIFLRIMICKAKSLFSMRLKRHLTIWIKNNHIHVHANI